MTTAQSVIAIQGVKGSYHHMAAKQYFNKLKKVIECNSFDAVIKCLLDNEGESAIMAIENSIAGSILPNYALIDHNNLQITGETYLNINHNLMALPKQELGDIKEVYSHPMALLQCKKFFDDYPHIRLIEAEDTAGEARRISESKLLGVAAIASTEAAERYQLNTIANSIQTIKNNVTRFVVVEKERGEISEKKINKAALKFILAHQRGSLATVLNVMSDCQLNLTKIQSLPVIETPGKYAFFVDVRFDSYENYKKAKAILEIMATECKVLGEYTTHKE